MQSMTGYAVEEGKVGETPCLIEIKSVNHRFLDIRARTPYQWNFLEPVIQEFLRKQLKRGTVEVNVRPKVSSKDITQDVQYAVDEKALASFMLAIEKIQGITKIKHEPTLTDILRNEKILIPLEQDLKKEAIEATFVGMLERAVSKLELAREKEGKAILAVLQRSLESLKNHTEQIQGMSEGQSEETKKKLLERIAKWKLKDLDPQRLEWETAFYADRSQITEEIDRLGAHFDSFEDEMKKGREVGRKLDFITQEMHREINTIASKSQNIEITKLCIASKAEIEKLREQVQNVE